MIPNENSQLKHLTEGINEFALSLSRKAGTDVKNLFFSPYSIYQVLVVLYAGARGDTKIQIAEAIQFTQDKKQLHSTIALLETNLNDLKKMGVINFNLANSLWLQNGIILREEFLKLVEQNYGMEINKFDFSKADNVLNKINTWIAQKTENRINEIVSSEKFDPLTLLIIVNAIYFKGKWENTFDNESTATWPFNISKNEQVEIMMMTQMDHFGYKETNEWQILKLPYIGNWFSMVILLPKENKELKKLEKSLNTENLTRWTNNVRKKMIKVFLPRFKITSSLNPGKILKSMGITDAFSEKADFSEMMDNGDIKEFTILHKALINVNESGTEAAATSGSSLIGFIRPKPEHVFCADHPFIFLIQDNSTGCIMFLGRLNNPEE